MDPPQPQAELLEIVEVGALNTEQLLECVRAYPSIPDFLCADVRVPIHPVQLPTRRDRLRRSCDVDGIVMEMSDMSGIQSGVHYLNIQQVYVGGVRKMFQYLKKHIDLTQCSESGLQALRLTVGHKLADIDGGFFLNLVCLPLDLQDPDYRLTRPNLHAVMAVGVLNEVLQNFRVLVRNLPRQEMSRSSVQKQSTLTERYRLCWQDMRFMLDLMDRAVATANNGQFFRVVPYIMQFGQRDRDPLDLSEVVVLGSVKNVTVHVSLTLTSKSPDIHILYSRYALEQLVGVRGSLYSVLGMHECCNFQSNLNRLPMDVCPSLLQVFGRRGKVRFVQLYVDSPHHHFQQPFKHPVSGALATCNLSHPNYQAAVRKRAFAYVQNMEEIREHLVIQLGVRMEQVVFLEGEDIPMVVKPRDYFSLS
ncbi:hypothetical protein ABVT39_025373 [Epinephelus coioides]